MFTCPTGDTFVTDACTLGRKRILSRLIVQKGKNTSQLGLSVQRQRKRTGCGRFLSVCLGLRSLSLESFGLHSRNLRFGWIYRRRCLNAELTSRPTVTEMIGLFLDSWRTWAEYLPELNLILVRNLLAGILVYLICDVFAGIWYLTL